jgi:hypothetical protein
MIKKRVKIPSDIETALITIGMLRLLGEDTLELENDLKRKIRNLKKYRMMIE